jgi:hypothetical protein
MRVGGKGGKGSIYRVKSEQDSSGIVVNFSGSLIPEPSEKMLSCVTEWYLRISDRIRYQNSSGRWIKFFPEAGWGTMYFTDRRMVFLRHLDMYQLQAVYMGGLVSDELRIRSFDLMNALEFLEIRYEDVTTYFEGKHLVRIMVKGGAGEEFGLEMSDSEFNIVLKAILSHMRVDGRKMSVAMETMNRLYLSPAKGVESAKHDKWGQARVALLGVIVALLLGHVFLASCVWVVLVRDDWIGLIIGASVYLGFLYLALLAVSEWRMHSFNQKNIPSKYPCTNCGELISRREISCPRCGAVVWWLYERRNPIAGARHV